LIASRLFRRIVWWEKESWGPCDGTRSGPGAVLDNCRGRCRKGPAFEGAMVCSRKNRGILAIYGIAGGGAGTSGRAPRSLEIGFPGIRLPGVVCPMKTQSRGARIWVNGLGAVEMALRQGARPIAGGWGGGGGGGGGCRKKKPIWVFAQVKPARKFLPGSKRGPKEGYVIENHLGGVTGFGPCPPIKGGGRGFWGHFFSFSSVSL